jgi:septal ring factor EnvC (AmiA/AmiB activator)
LNRAGTTLAEMEQTQKQQTNNTICRLTEENLLLKNSWEKSNDTSTNLSQELKEANEEIKELEKREVEDRKYLYSLNLQALSAMSDLKTARDKIKKMKEDHSQICVSFHEQLKNFCKEISILKRSCNAKDVFINQKKQEIEEIRSKMLTERMTIKEALEQSKQGHDQLMELLQQHHPLL